MDARKALLHVWMVGLLPILLYLTIALALGWWLGWMVGAVALLLVLWSWIEWWGKVKQDVLNGLPETLKFVPARMEDFPNLDRVALDRLTEGLAALGFSQLQDYQLDPEAVGGTSSGFARCLGHPQQHCYIEVFQAFPKEGNPLPLVFSAISYLDDNWILATTTNPLDSISMMWRDRRTCWSYHPDSSPEAIVQIHLERCQQMVEDLGIQVQSEISWHYYEQQQQLSALKRRRSFQDRNVAIALIQATYAEFNPVSEWWGDYRKHIKKRA